MIGWGGGLGWWSSGDGMGERTAHVGTCERRCSLPVRWDESVSLLCFFLGKGSDWVERKMPTSQYRREWNRPGRKRAIS